MPPRLSHRKTRTGCKRCKARKVKRDEEKPKCGACKRHAVHCEYPASPYDPQSPASDSTLQANAAEQFLELRLMHEWMAYTCMSLSTTWEFWKHQCPLTAFEYRWLLDAMLAGAALHASRAKPRCWSALEGRMVNFDAAGNSIDPLPEHAVYFGWKSASKARRAVAGKPSPGSVTVFPAHNHAEMLETSRKYFTRALDGHQKAVAVLWLSNIRAAYLCSILICYYSLFTLNEPSDESLMLDPLKWFKLSRGTLFIIQQWKDWIGEAWFIEAMYGEPDLSDDNELFRKEHQEGFEYLLSPVEGDTIRDEDRLAYERTLSYFGLMYKGIAHGLDSPLAMDRRVIAMPARVPIRLGNLVEANDPRAAAILAHVFATMKPGEDRFPWFQGIAQRQIPILCDSLPPRWSGLVAWPRQVVNDNISAGPFLSPLT
ncbi:Putative zn(2)-C6 fungal-type DNA-binding domain-containing protein [Septoria linicola]|uniref:Zn(2)-C6 fungal-type DNA-binding domain-containing protein n=1 Tax=Septoria linicola TaxID=215465 RepID=A0A9Q9AJU1_9PEZI|nr:Putative zn(2)-C6 fungal-type DNA-binding domain-containing protein [Septoria linicola]